MLRPTLSMCCVLLPLLPAPCGAAEPVPLRVVTAQVVSAADFEAGQRVFAVVMRRAGVSYTLTQEPQERAVSSLRAGLYDADAARVEGFDRDVPGMLRVDPPLLTITVRAYGRRPLPEPAAQADLARYRVAHVRGQRAVEHYLPKGALAYPVVTPAACLGMAAAGRVDYCLLGGLFPAEPGPGREPLRAQVINQLPLYIWVGPGREALAQRLGEAARSAGVSGDLDRALLGQPAR